MPGKTSNPHHRDRAAQTRKTILHAAIREFGAHGLSGARTDAIAQAAKVNKALLYYYFKSKSGLYSAALEEVSGTVVESALAALDPIHSAGERLLRTAVNHFDRIYSQREFQSLMQQEMVRVRLGESEAMPLLMKKVFKPLLERLRETIDEGIGTGELCEMDWLQVVYSMLGANVFFFLSAPMMRLALPTHPFDNAAIKFRRAAAVQFLSNAIFNDRARGATLAQGVLADMPLPRVKNVRILKGCL